MSLWIFKQIFFPDLLSLLFIDIGSSLNMVIGVACPLQIRLQLLDNISVLSVLGAASNLADLPRKSGTTSVRRFTSPLNLTQVKSEQCLFSILILRLPCHVLSATPSTRSLISTAPGFRAGAAHNDHHLRADPPTGSLLCQCYRETRRKASTTDIYRSRLSIQGLPTSTDRWMGAEQGSSRHQCHCYRQWFVLSSGTSVYGSILIVYLWCRLSPCQGRLVL